jgi:hypothetical protein
MVSCPNIFSRVFQYIRPAVFSFLRRCCRLAPGSLIPVLPSEFTRRLFAGVRSLRAPPATSFPIRLFLTRSPLRRATGAQRVVLLRATANLFWATVQIKKCDVFGYRRRRSCCYFVLFPTSLVVTTITFTMCALHFRVDSLSWLFL